MYDETNLKSKKKKPEAMRFFHFDKEEKETSVKLLDETKEKNRNMIKFDFDFRKISKKLGIFLVVAFLVIFASTKMGNRSQNKVLEKNLDTIKNGAYKYFKENDRPVEKDEEYTITLQDLIDDHFVDSIKDKKGNPCNANDSEITIAKKTTTKYDLVAKLSCGNQSMEKSYTLAYANSTTASNDSNVYYKLKKEVLTNNYTYSCNNGYVLNGKYCYGSASVLSATPIARYKTTSEKVKKADYKKVDDILEYVDPVLYTTNESYYCSNKNATLIGNQCVRTKEYSISNRCSSPYTKQDGSRCYYRTKANEAWSSWSFVSEETSRSKKKTTDTDKYDYIETVRNNGKTIYVYNHFVRFKNYTCPSTSGEQVELKGSYCYHYVNLTPTKKCSNGYSLNQEGTACVSSTPALLKPSKTEKVCPTGYEEEKSGDTISCYRRIPQEGYYYCKDDGYYLDGDQCKRDASSELIGYKCPTGYQLNGNQCIKVLSGDKIAATKTNEPDINYTYKWSKKKVVSGWTWTGETKDLEHVES